MILVSLLLGVLVLVLIVLAVGPLESLGWWSEHGAEKAEATIERLRIEHEAGDGPPPYSRYVIYLSGIGAIDGHSRPEEEEPLIAAIRGGVPDACLITDVFPYGMDSTGLTAQRPLARLWEAIDRVRLKKPASLLPMLVNLRNAVQVFVCADRRYGPTYNIGTAQQLLKALLRNGYRLGSGVPVTLVGWSGGAQISLGAAWYLGLTKIPLTLISIGGMMADDYGLDRMQHVYHLRGTKDPFEKLGWIMFAGRWPIAVGSPWSRAVKEDRISVYDLGPMQHNGTHHYFDAQATAPDGRSYLQVTTDAVVALLTGHEVEVIPT
jgi:pimeloyl-ACP methyl ester carboxylesterase